MHNWHFLQNVHNFLWLQKMHKLLYENELKWVSKENKLWVYDYFEILWKNYRVLQRQLSYGCQLNGVESRSTKKLFFEFWEMIKFTVDQYLIFVRIYLSKYSIIVSDISSISNRFKAVSRGNLASHRLKAVIYEKACQTAFKEILAWPEVSFLFVFFGIV